MNDPQPTDGNTEEAAEQPMNRAERRHAGKHGGSGHPASFQKGATGGSTHGPHNPLSPQHKKGTIPRKKGM